MDENGLRKLMGDEWVNQHQAEERRFQDHMKRSERAGRLANTGKLEKALELYEGLAQDASTLAGVYFRPAIIYRKLKRYDDEVRLLERFIWVWENVATYHGKELMIAKAQERIGKAQALKAKAEAKAQR